MAAGNIPEHLGRNLGPEFRDDALELCRELLKWGKVHNLTGHRDMESAWDDLILDALALAPLAKSPLVLDIGSGAGFPGLPLALSRDDINVTMLEPRAKRISFQKHIVRKLGLDGRANPVMGMAGKETLNGVKFDTVILRAVGSVEKSLALARHYKKEDGIILLPRGMKDLALAQELGFETRKYQTRPEAAPRMVVIA